MDKSQTNIDSKKIYILDKAKNWSYFTFNQEQEWVIWDILATNTDIEVIQNCKAEYQKLYMIATWKINLYG